MKTGYMIARASCSPIAGRGCDNPALQYPFLIGVGMALTAVGMFAYERVAWKSNR